MFLLFILFLSLSSCYAVTTTIQANVQAFVGGDGSDVAGTSDTSTGPGESSLFTSISSIYVDAPYGVMCVTDKTAHEVRLVNLPAREVQRLGGVAGVQGYGAGPLPASPLYDNPTSCYTTVLTPLIDDRVTFVGDSGNCIIRQIFGTESFYLSGELPQDHQGPRIECGVGQDGDTATTVRWSDQIGPMMVTQGNNLLVVDTGSSALRLVSLGLDSTHLQGATQTVAGTIGVSGHVDGSGSSAQFLNPTQFQYIPTTNTLYLIDENRIRIVVIPDNEWDGEWQVTTFGIGTLPFTPSGIAIDTETKIMYLTSPSNVLYAITNYETDPVFTVIAGVDGMMGWTNGIGNVARFFDPRDLQLKRDSFSDNALLFINDYENHKIRLVNITVTISSGASGDPQFVGFQGQSYQVHGQPDEIFNLISSPTLSMNANFVYIQSGKCEYNNTECWTHPGTYVDALGLRIGTNIEDRVKMVAAPHLMGLRIWYNNTEMMIGQEIMMMDSTVIMTRTSYDRVDIITPQFKIGVVNSDSFFNLEIALLDTAALNAGRIRHTGTAIGKYPKFPYHGLIGQTWKNAVYLPSQSYIEGDIDDYRVESQDLFGCDYTYNYFGHEGDRDEQTSVV